MSTKTATALHGCCVCGKETSTRCSACAKVGIELFFCSPEHQKLVWKGAHSKVCGEKAHPFCYPDMTAAEANAVKELGAVDMLNQTTSGELKGLQKYLVETYNLPGVPKIEHMRIAAAMTKICGVPEDQFEQVVPTLLQQGHVLPPDQRLLLHRVARSMVFDQLTKRGPAAATHLTPFDQVGNLEALFAVRAPQLLGSKEAAQALHRALILCQLGVLVRRNPTPSGSDAAWLDHAFRAVAVASFRDCPPKSMPDVHETTKALNGLLHPSLHVTGWCAHNLSFELIDAYLSPSKT
ncbi:hypothetical protein JCM8097_007954 [Rhodosporidiobolus ruineniae]